MNTAMIRRLARKDLTLHRMPIAGACGAGVIAIALLLNDSQASFFAGCVLLITIVIGFGLYLAVGTVVTERSEKTLTFVMSLPVSVQEYTAAKLLANLGMFLIPWTAIGVGAVLIVLLRSAVPDGLLPFYLLLLLELLAGYVLVLAVALVTESMAWTIAAIVFSNLFVQAFMYYTSHLPSLAAAMTTERIVWDGPVITILIAELAVIALILLITWRLQSRKTDFM